MDDLTRLLVAARDGDRMAFAAFVRQSQADVWRFCAHLVDPQAADDLTQETYLRALQAAGQFRGDASARTWLLSIARRTCADAIRRRRRRRVVPSAAAEAAPDASGALELQQLVAGLEPDRRAAFVLTQLLGLSYAETAAACEVPVGTIRSRVARARQDLVDMLGIRRRAR